MSYGARDCSIFACAYFSSRGTGHPIFLDVVKPNPFVKANTNIFLPFLPKRRRPGSDVTSSQDLNGYRSRPQRVIPSTSSSTTLSPTHRMATVKIDVSELPVDAVCVFQANRAEVHRVIPVALLVCSAHFHYLYGSIDCFSSL